MRRKRLQEALHDAGLVQEELASRAGVDTKTVNRWLAGVMSPSAQNRRRVADALGIANSDELWTIDEPPNNDGSGEIVATWPHRALIPAETWRDLVRQARSTIDLAGYALLFLPEQDPQLTSVLADRAEAGCQVRIMMGDPDSDHVERRAREEGLGQGVLAARIRTSLRHLAPLRGRPGIQVALFDAPLYSSIFRYDSEIIYTPHMYGRPGYQTIALHLRKAEGDGLVAQLEQTLDDLWRDCTPAWREE